MSSDPDDPQEGPSGLCDDSDIDDSSIDDSDVDKYFDIIEEVSKKRKKGDLSSSEEEVIQSLTRKRKKGPEHLHKGSKEKVPSPAEETDSCPDGKCTSY